MACVRRLACKAAILVALAVAPGARGQSFEPPVNVSQSANGSYLPSLSRDLAGADAGTLRLFWHDFTSAPNALWCSDDAGASFAAGATCGFDAAPSWTPRAASDGLGRTHVVWRSRSAGIDDVFHATLDAAGWSPPTNLSISAAGSRNPVIALDPWDRPHAVWEEDVAGGTRYFDSHFDGAAWSAPSDTGISADVADVLRLACDGAGTLHAAWAAGSTSLTEVLHAERPDAGTWSVAQDVSASPGEYSSEPSVAVDAGDEVVVAWVEQSGGAGTESEIVMARRPAAGAWSAPAPVTALGSNAFHPALAIGADDVPRLAFGAGPIGDRELLFVEAPGAVPVNVSLSPGVDSNRATLILDGAGAPWIAWQEGSVPTPEIFLAVPSGGSAPAGLLFVRRAAQDAVLDWIGGAPPFVVRRGDVAETMSAAPELTPPGGTDAATWTDAGAIGDGALRFYLVD